MRALALAAPVACGAKSPAPVTLAPAGKAFGTAHPYAIIAMPADGRWSVICQARSDTDGDGRIEVFWQLHGEEAGDRMVAYLNEPSGREREIENVLAYDDSGRWLAIVEGGRAVLVDMHTGKRRAIAGTLPRFEIGEGLRVWRFDPRGEHLLFFRDGAPIVLELARGTERVLAPKAWRAAWSADGSWVELSILDGDTNGDGFAFGENLSPFEGVPGQDCGRKFEWAQPDLFANDPEGAHLDRALAALDNPDHLTRKLWRVSDGLTIDGELGVDRDTVITRLPDGALGIGPPNAPGSIIAAPRCKIPLVSPTTRAAIVTCEESETSFSVTWVREGRRVALAPLDDDRLVDEPFGFFDAGTQLGSMRTGEILVRAKRFLWMRWNDADHAFVLVDDGAQLRWSSGRVVQLPRSDGAEHFVAGNHFVYDRMRVDLATAATVTLPVRPVGVRADGAVLVDGGPQKLPDNMRGPRVGPLRWLQ